MRIGLLGELEVLDDDGSEVTVAGAKLRALLAVLALHVGRVVPAEQLVDALWGEDPPAAVRNGLQGLASKLRRALGSADLVVMRGDGYALELRPRPSTSSGSSSAPPRAGRWPRPVSSTSRRAAGRGRRALAGRSPRRLRLRGLRVGGDHPAVRVPPRVARGAARPRAPAGPPPASDRPARGARRHPSAARGAPRAADARAVPRRAAGRRPPGLPGGPSAPGRGARPRTGTRAAPVGVGDPRPGPVADAARRAATGAAAAGAGVASDASPRR